MSLGILFATITKNILTNGFDIITNYQIKV